MSAEAAAWFAAPPRLAASTLEMLPRPPESYARLDLGAMAMNGEQAALEAAWRVFLRDPHETSFAQVVAFARGRHPSVSREMVRAEFERRFRRNPAAAASSSSLEDVRTSSKRKGV